MVTAMVEGLVEVYFMHRQDDGNTYDLGFDLR